jgi:Mn2+/Fe2+ NRAMP family transporter
MSQPEEHDTLPPSTDPATDEGIVEPPSDFMGIMKRLGPGLIIAGSIVGSGELIATTKTGAQAGMSLLWLIIIGCLIKVFVQIELGRYAISHGETTLTALDRVPGPTVRVDLWSTGPQMRGNWIMWLWFVMACCTIAQLGAIVGGVGQALAITFPITRDYQEAIVVPSEGEFQRFIDWEDDITKNGSRKLNQLTEDRRKRVLRGHEILTKKIEGLGAKGELIIGLMRDGKTGSEIVDSEDMRQPKIHLIEPSTNDDKYWAAVVAIFTSWLLFWGRYGLIQNISLVLVVSFTFITIGNVIALQSTEEFAIPMSEFLKGLSFGAPEQIGDKNPWVTAIATFGIIGVGASELIAYPYWCLEKGYAKFAGKRSPDENWARRARGWMKVMHYDAFASMIVYTVATIAFYVMGVAVLFNEGSDPDGMRMVSTLATAYVPVFGEYAKWLFLIGAIAVLYSTFMVANAGNARMIADAVKVFGFIPKDDEAARRRGVTILSVALPLVCLAVFWTGANPVYVILVAGTMQAFMLPVVGLGAIYFRYKLTDERLRPSRLWDVCLIISFLGLLLAGAYGIISRLI